MQIEIIIIGLLLVLSAAAIHGALGVGFPMLATPVLALVYDLKVAITFTIVPSFLAILFSLYQCRNYSVDLKEHYLLIAVVSLGSLSGAWLLTWANASVLKLLLAGAILLYLLSGFLRKYLCLLSSRPVAFPVLMGASAGLIGGATNAIAPLLMIYLLERVRSTKEIILVANICFLIGKLMQLAVFSLFFTFEDLQLVPLSMITLVTYIGLLAGFKFQSTIDEYWYRSIIRYALSIFMCILTYQGVISLFFSGVSVA
ncbi:TSUP family transporter [Microbulbifer echini]|uniref:Probable membrane transporter protein n=1 Tax=Microbulbifer echini TaxID=1529067 RepID=A0ABV4NTG1_9GAMM